MKDFPPFFQRFLLISDLQLSDEELHGLKIQLEAYHFYDDR